MNIERKSKFGPLRAKATFEAERWAESVANLPLPVPIHELAKSRKIQRIEFEPILSTAGIVKRGDGYVIVVNTDARGISKTAGDFMDINAGTIRELPPPIRFTIAHEIAHAILFDVAGSFKSRTLRAARGLESTCSIIASKLLMPASRVKREIGDALFDPNHIKKVVDAFGVSSQAFILRLQLDDLRSHFERFEGLLGLACSTEGGTKVVACEIFGVESWKVLGIGPAQQGSDGSEEEPSLFGASQSRSDARPIGRSISELLTSPDIEQWLKEKDQINESITVTRYSPPFKCKVTACRVHRLPPGFLFAAFKHSEQ